MKTSHLISFATIAALLLAFQAQAAVQVTPEPEPEPQKEAPPAVQPTPAGATEKSVAFQLGDRFLSATSGGTLRMTGEKISTTQTFTLIDSNGGELADGDEVRIQYIPGKGSRPDVSKSSFWMETPEGIKRGRPGNTFKLKQVGTKYAFQTLKGKFLTAPNGWGVLGTTDKQEEAFLVDIIDVSQGVPKRPKKAQTTETATPAPADSKPAAE